MSGEQQLADQVRKSRTSIVFLILSAATIYYSTQIYLKYPPNWWTWIIAVAGVLFFIVAMVLMYYDHQHESNYRDLLRREKRADVISKESEVDELQENQTEIEHEDGSPADIAGEEDALPKN